MSSAKNPATAGLPIPKAPRWKQVRDSVYLQEVEGRVETAQPLLAAAVFDNTLYVGNKLGVQRLESDTLVPAGGPTDRVSRLRALNGALFAFSGQGLWRYDAGSWFQLSGETFSDGCVHLGSVVVTSLTHAYQVNGDLLEPLNTAPAGPPFSGFASYAEVLRDMSRSQPILGVASYAETLYIRHATAVGLLQDGKFVYNDVSDWGHLPIGATTRDLMAFGSQLLVPTDKGLAALRGMSWLAITGKDGLCYEDTICVAEGFDGADYWIGTSRGAIRVIDGEYQYFGCQRWIPNDRVNAIACGDRVVYIATDGGLGIITYEPYTLQKKADWYERWIEDWGMQRLGFVGCLVWDERDKDWRRFVSDNDGGWTAHLLSAFSFKYAVTKDRAVREQAVEAFRALKWLEEITPIPGFPARAIAGVGEHCALAPTGSAGRPSEWNPTPDGKWLWKGDTSSDEVGAHFYATAIFYELASEGEDRDAARKHICRIMSHIIDNGWMLRDLDGKPTRWARWEPEYLKTPEGFEARGLQALEALSMVTTAYAITGDEKFQRGKQQLLDLGYHHEVLRQKLVFPTITHFDDRLAFLAYHPLLTYETDPQLRSLYRRSLERSWEIKRFQNMVWFDLIYGALSENEIDTARAVTNLRAWPLDCRSYTFTNSHRADLSVPKECVNYIGDWKCMTTREIGVVDWGDDFMQLDGGNDGKGVNDPSGFIEAYWMARYYGMMLPPDSADARLLSVENRRLTFASN
ncbi:MAG: hypothetical protein HZB26_08565 [Candidatus Hydrogenedentes bacterium]|nr:hypothetical protein [Candidatus Hydrogenedentota bacterium]